MISFINAVGASLVSAVVYIALLRIWGVIPPRAWDTSLSRSYYHKIFPWSGAQRSDPNSL